jgi:hypothetical protein
MKIRFSILLLIIAVFVSSVISGCSYGNEKEAYSSNYLMGNQSDDNGYYGDLSASQKTVSADKIYGASDNTLYSKVSTNASKKTESQQTLSEQQTESSSSEASISQGNSEYSSSEYYSSSFQISSSSSSHYSSSSQTTSSSHIMSSSQTTSSSHYSSSSQASSNFESSSSLHILGEAINSDFQSLKIYNLNAKKINGGQPT